MKLTQQQALLLMQILQDSLKIVNGFGVGRSQREELWCKILNQQGTEIKDIDAHR